MADRWFAVQGGRENLQVRMYSAPRRSWPGPLMYPVVAGQRMLSKKEPALLRVTRAGQPGVSQPDDVDAADLAGLRHSPGCAARTRSSRTRSRGCHRARCVLPTRTRGRTRAIARAAWRARAERAVAESGARKRFGMRSSFLLSAAAVRRLSAATLVLSVSGGGANWTIPPRRPADADGPGTLLSWWGPWLVQASSPRPGKPRRQSSSGVLEGDPLINVCLPSAGTGRAARSMAAEDLGVFLADLRVSCRAISPMWMPTRSSTLPAPRSSGGSDDAGA